MSFGLAALRAAHFWAVAVCLGGGGLLWQLSPARPRGGDRALRVAAFAAGLTGLAWFAATFAGIAGSPGALLSGDDWSAFLAAPFGPGWAVLLALAVAALGAGAFVRPPTATALGAAFAVDQAWLGHGASGTGPLGDAMLAIYAGHVLAAFIWLGALTMLCLCLRDTNILQAGLSAVSRGGLLVVAVLILSGCFNTAVHMSDASQIATTTYGRILAAKLALVAIMLALAAFNRAEASFGISRGVTVSVGLETALGLIVLCLAAALGITAPPV